MNIRKFIPAVATVLLLVTVSISTYGQGRATLRGSISDEFGASIVGATVTVTDANGTQKTATTGPDGGYSFTGLTPGKYKLHAAATGFATSEDAEIDVAAGRRDPVNITLKIAAIETQVKVNADTPLSTDTNNNANQQVLSGKDRSRPYARLSAADRTAVVDILKDTRSGLPAYFTLSPRR